MPVEGFSWVRHSFARASTRFLAEAYGHIRHSHPRWAPTLDSERRNIAAKRRLKRPGPPQLTSRPLYTLVSRDFMFQLSMKKAAKAALRVSRTWRADAVRPSAKLAACSSRLCQCPHAQQASRHAGHQLGPRTEGGPA